MRGRVLTTLACLAVCLVVAPAHAAPRESTWTAPSTGVRTGALDLRSTVELPLEDTVNDVFFGRRPADSVIQMKGRYGGIVITNRAGGVVGGLIRYAGAKLFLGWGQSNDSDRHVLAAGRYWVTVFGDGPVRVSLPVRGGADRAISLPRPGHGAFTDQYDTDLVQRTLPVASFDAAIKIGPRTVYVVMGALTSSLPGVDIDDLCLDRATQPTCIGGHNYAGTGGGVSFDRGGQSVLYGEPGPALPSPGSYTARYRVATAGAHDSHALFTAAIDVP